MHGTMERLASSMGVDCQFTLEYYHYKKLVLAYIEQSGDSMGNLVVDGKVGVPRGHCKNIYHGAPAPDTLSRSNIAIKNGLQRDLLELAPSGSSDQK
jgi:hypothetical protein